jgi:ribosomal protein S18 acetylase RimI-like enzyme
MITITEAQIRDIPPIRRVLAVTWRDTYRSFLSEESIEQVTARWHSEEILQNEIESSATYCGVAKTDQDEVVAMITAHEAGQILLVSRLYVLPAHQRRGIGSRLLRASYAKFSETTMARLHVEAQNPHGRAFYRKLGFLDVKRKSEDVFGTLLQSIVMECGIVRTKGEEQ